MHFTVDYVTISWLGTVPSLVGCLATVHWQEAVKQHVFAFMLCFL